MIGKGGRDVKHELSPLCRRLRADVFINLHDERDVSVLLTQPRFSS